MRNSKLLLLAVVLPVLSALFAGFLYAACNSEAHPEGYELGVSITGPESVGVGFTKYYSCVVADVGVGADSFSPTISSIDWSGGGSDPGGTGTNFTTRWDVPGSNTLSVFVRGGDLDYDSGLTVECTNMATHTVISFELSLGIDEVICTKSSHTNVHALTVSVVPTNYPCPVTLQLNPLEEGDGSAVFVTNGLNAITLEVTGSTNLAVQGISGSSAISNMIAEADIDDDACASNRFTVVEVDTLTGTEVLHGDNSAADSTDTDDTNTVWICQMSNDTANLELELSWMPTNFPASDFHWKAVLTNGAATSQWGGSGTFDPNPANLTWSALTSTDREFRFLGWYACPADVGDEPPQRIIDVKVVDFTQLKLATTDASRYVDDTTRPDEAQSITNTLYLCEGTNGQAQMTIQGLWEPVSAASTNMYWEIVTESAGDPSPEWDISTTNFSANPATVTWTATNAASSVTNREFIVRGWYDCDHSGVFDPELPHRELYVTIIKVELESDKAVESPKPFDCGKTEADLFNPCEFAPSYDVWDIVRGPESNAIASSLTIYHKEVSDAAGDAQAFDIALRVLPDGVPTDWALKSGPTGSGTLSDADQSEATFSDPVKGGRYIFTAEVGDITTDVQVWLPISGPDISAEFQNQINYIKNDWGPRYQANLNVRVDALVPWFARMNMDLSTYLALLWNQKVDDLLSFGLNMDYELIDIDLISDVGGLANVEVEGSAGGDRDRFTMKGASRWYVTDFSKRSNMAYAMAARAMGFPSLAITEGPDLYLRYVSDAVGTRDTAAAKESYRAAIDLIDGDTLPQVMDARGRAMQEPAGRSRKEWPDSTPASTTYLDLNTDAHTTMEALTVAP